MGERERRQGEGGRERERDDECHVKFKIHYPLM